MSRKFCIVILLSIAYLSACGRDGGDSDTTTAGFDMPPEITTVNRVEVQENSVEVLQVHVSNTEQILDFSLDNTLADSALFSINSLGALQFKVAPDFENAQDENADNIYETRVKVSNGNQATIFDLSVVVIDVPPDASANSAPMILNENRLSVTEHTRQVVAIAATDKEEHSITFAIGGDDSEDFEITSEGELSFVITPNYESPRDKNNDNFYEITITVGDGSLSSSIDMVVEVTNENDAPVIVSRNELNAYEKGTFVQQIQVEDEDGDIAINYQLGGADRNLFAVSDTGELRFVEAHLYDDAHINNSFNITLTVDDGLLSNEQALSVHLIKHVVKPDVNYGSVDPVNMAQRLGYTVTNTDNQSRDTIEDAALSKDGKLIVVGSRWGGQSRDIKIWRYTADGVLDTDLETGFGPVDPQDSGKRLGYNTHDNAAGGNGFDRAAALSITSDNKIVIVGKSRNRSDSVSHNSVVWRYTTDGFLDSEFGDQVNNGPGLRKGYVVLPYGSNEDTLNDVVLTEDNSILATGTRGLRPTLGDPVDDMVIWKLTPSGEPDTTFGFVSPNDPTTRLGFVTHNGPRNNINDAEGYDTGSFIAFSQTGEIILLGISNDKWIIWHYSSTGEVGATYFLRSRLHYSDVRQFAISSAMGLKVTPDNKILVLAAIRPYANNIPSRPILIRLFPNGDLDDSPTTGFGPFDSENSNLRMGYNEQLLDSSNIFTSVYDFAVLPDNKIIVSGVGSYQSESRADTMLLRYSEDGFLEGYDYHSTQADGSNERGNTLVLDNDRIIVAGEYFKLPGQATTYRTFVKSFTQLP